MKVTNGEVFEARPAIQELSKVKLPIPSAVQVAKLAKALAETLAIIDAVRNPAIKTYGFETKRPGQFTVDETCEGFAKFNEEMAELMAQEVEVEIEKVKLPMTAQIKCKCGNVIQAPLEIEPRVLMLLEKFIEWL